jgi:phosphoesterase RecJ-like protein
MYEQAKQIDDIVIQSQSVVIIQADNPDADSLGSALALEQILGDLGKTTHLYCGVDMPGYLHYMSCWDRVNKDIPKQFDLSIIVDASTMTLIEKLSQSGQQGWVAAKPVVVLDHHETVENVVPFATVILNDFHSSSTGELIYKLSDQLGWKLNLSAQEFIMSSILGDTQGLTNQLASAETYDVMASMVRNGVDRPNLEELRRASSKMPLVIFRYKADLIKRTEFHCNDRLALVVVDQTAINNFSPLYNPAALIQGDLLQTEKISLAIVIKRYDSDKVTGAIRANPGAAIAAELADHFGGGGHKFASGFKIEKVEDFEKLKKDIIEFSEKLLSDKHEAV